MSAAPLIECTSTEITVGQSGQRGKRPSDLDYSHTSSTAGLPAKTKSFQTWIQFYSVTHCWSVNLQPVFIKRFPAIAQHFWKSLQPFGKFLLFRVLRSFSQQWYPALVCDPVENTVLVLWGIFSMKVNMFWPSYAVNEGQVSKTLSTHVY